MSILTPAQVKAMQEALAVHERTKPQLEMLQRLAVADPTLADLVQQLTVKHIYINQVPSVALQANQELST